MKIYAFVYDPDNQIIKCYCKDHAGRFVGCLHSANGKHYVNRAAGRDIVCHSFTDEQNAAAVSFIRKAAETAVYSMDLSCGI